MGAGRTAWLAVAILALGPVLARAGDDETAPHPPVEFETHLFEISSLTAGNTDFWGAQGPYPVPVGTEETPRSGPGEEPIKPFGDADALIEWIKSSQGEDRFLLDGGLFAAHGQDTLFLRAPADLCADVARELARLDAEAMSLVVVECVALLGDPSATRGEGGVAGAISSGALLPIAAARATGHLDQVVVAFSGGERAYLMDHDVEVAQNAKTADPIVGVFRDGLSLCVRATRTGADLLVDVKAWLARVGAWSSRTTGDGDRIEEPAIDGAAIDTLLRVRPGEWAVVHTSGDVVLALRVSLRPRPLTPIPSRPLPSPAPSGKGGPLDLARFDVRDFGVRIGSTRARDIYVVQSNYTPVEPPELPEPPEMFPYDRLVEVTLRSQGPTAWQRDGASLEVKNGWFWIRHDVRHREGVRRLVEELRTRLPRPLAYRATVVSMPAASYAPLLVAAPGDLLADGGAAILARPGAEVVERATVRGHARSRVGTEQGRVATSVYDYDVEIAEGVTIANPATAQNFEGWALDVSSAMTPQGDAASCEVRWNRAQIREIRKIPTRHGDIEGPNISLQRFRGRTVVPLGGTVLLSASLWEGRATLVLLTVEPG